MGLLSEGSPLTWEETKRQAEHVRKHGIKQFIAQYKKLKDRTRDDLYWGDEVEYILVKFDHDQKKVRLALKAQDALHKLNDQHTEESTATWHPEYADYMVEGTPAKPYGGLMAHFNLVERNMQHRREQLLAVLDPDQEPMSLTTFPRLGCGSFTEPIFKPTPAAGSSKSLFFPDEAINSGHVRFRTLTRNIRERRGEKVVINVPLYKDTHTEVPYVEDYSHLADDGEAKRAALPNHIYMDCMGFGMGNCCLQVTFQACNIDEARLLYDQLTALCPILLALSAASPLYRGHLADIDTRWTVISQAVDDRTKEERGLEPLQENKFLINKSRYDSIDSYLSFGGRCYNDIDLVYDKDIYKQLKDAGVDDLLSRHLAHLFIRDPISLFSEKLNQNDDEDTDHFENIQSTNWQTMRFKPPPPGSNIGWRVEFRPMEVQLTDFENAAYVVFIVLLTRVILTFKLNFIIPISKVDENMKTAYKRDAVRQGKFYFRKDVITDFSPPEAAECLATCEKLTNCEKKECMCIDDEYTQMDINEIINGKGEFVGLIPLIHKYMDNVEIDVDTQCTVLQYLKLIAKRASGELMTTARWIRGFVNDHPDYKHDSIISDSVAYDLVTKCSALSKENTDVPELLFSHSTRSADTIPLAMSKAEQYFDEKSHTHKK